MTDRPLLDRYADTADAAAFAELVRRHGAMVLAAARRMARDDADDVAQAAFILLSRRAASLRERDSVAGWLYETTRLCARNARRARTRRARRLDTLREQTMPPTDPAAEPAWIAVLDYALAALPGGERGVVLLRYLENRTLAETAAALSLTPAAVAKRAERGIRRMRAFFRSSGYAVSAEQAVGALAVQAGVDPSHVSTLTNVSAKTATAGASATAKSAATAMLLAKLKVAAVLLAVVAAGGGATTLVVRHAMSTKAGARTSAAAVTPSPAAALSVTPPVALPLPEDVAEIRRTLASLAILLPEIRFDRVTLADAIVV